MKNNFQFQFKFLWIFFVCLFVCFIFVSSFTIPKKYCTFIFFCFVFPNSHFPLYSMQFFFVTCVYIEKVWLFLNEKKIAWIFFSGRNRKKKFEIKHNLIMFISTSHYRMITNSHTHTHTLPYRTLFVRKIFFFLFLPLHSVENLFLNDFFFYRISSC